MSQRLCPIDFRAAEDVRGDDGSYSSHSRQLIINSYRSHHLQCLTNRGGDELEEYFCITSGGFTSTAGSASAAGSQSESRPSRGS